MLAAGAYQLRQVYGEVEFRAFGERRICRPAQRRAVGERQQKYGAARRQAPNLHVEIGPDDERIFAVPAPDRRELLLADIHRPDGDDRMFGANDLVRGVQRDTKSDERVLIDPAELVGAERRRIGGVVGARTRGLNPRHVSQIGEFVRWFERADEVGKFVAVSREQWRARRLSIHKCRR